MPIALPAWLIALLRRLGLLPDDPPPKPPPSGDIVAQLLEAHNTARASYGLAPLTLDSRLATAAQQHTDWMVSTGTFSHAGEGGSWFDARARAAGYPMASGSENLALGHRTPQEAVDGWLSSTVGHRENVLGARWVDVGFGHGTGARGQYWTAVYGVQGVGAAIGAGDCEAPVPREKR